MIRPGETTLRLMLDPIASFLSDPATTEVVVNRPGEAGVERRGQWTWLELPELTYARLNAIATLCAAMSQQDVGPDRPLCASVLPDGQRVQICRPPAVAAGTISLTIRKPPSVAPSLRALSKGGVFSGTNIASTATHQSDAELVVLHSACDWDGFLSLAVRARKTIIVTGDTGSGKTTVARALLQEIPLHERLVTIEDTAEFGKLLHRNVVSLFYSKGDQGVARVKSESLMEASLRMRPNRVLMGELRDGAAFTFLRNVAAGHPGSITTCHSRSGAESFDAIRLMVKNHEDGKHLADADVREFLAQRIDVIVHCKRLDDDSRIISEVLFNPSANSGRSTLALAAE